MPVREPRMTVRMDVRLLAIPREFMRVPVMLIVDVTVLVLHRQVDVLVLMALRDMQPYARQH